MNKELKIISEYIYGDYYYNVITIKEDNILALLSLGYIDTLLLKDSFDGYFESITKEDIVDYLKSNYKDESILQEDTSSLAEKIMWFLLNEFWLINDFNNSSYHLLGYEVIEFKKCESLKPVSIEDIKRTFLNTK